MQKSTWRWRWEGRKQGPHSSTTSSTTAFPSTLLLAALFSAWPAPDGESVATPAVTPAETPAESDAATQAAVAPLTDGLLLAAGRATPPGLTASAAAERGRLAAEAQARVAEALAPDDPRRDVWLHRLQDVLADRAGTWWGEELWLAAAGTAGALRLTELEVTLAAALEADVTERRRLAAQLTLHEIHGLWFATPTEFADYLAELDAAGRPRGFVERQRALATENRTHLVRLFRYEPNRALEALAHEDPRLRTQAARVLGEVGAGRPDILEALFVRAEAEIWPAALHATFAALERLLAADWGNDASTEEWRARYVAAIESNVASAVPGLELALARALAGVAWGSEGGDRRPASDGLGLVAQLLRRLVRAGDAADREVLAGVMESLSALADLSRDSTGRLPESVLAGRLPVLELLEDPGRDPSVRLSAARAAATLAVASDVELLVDVFEQPSASAELEFVLLSTLRRLALQMNPASETANRLAAGVFARIADDDADLRRRALAFLADPELRPLLEGCDPGVLVARLGNEPILELRASLLRLLREFGGERELEALLAHAEFDALAGDDPALAANLARTLGVLANGNGSTTLRAAGRLASEDGEATGFARTLLALDLVAQLAPEVAAALQPGEHAQVVNWAVAVRTAGVRLANALPPSFVERLVRVHLPATVAEASETRPAAFHYRSALFLTDMGSPSAAQAEEIQRHFAQALSAPEPVEVGEAGEAGLFRARVRRDRARFRTTLGRDDVALEDYRAVMAWELARGETGAAEPVTEPPSELATEPLKEVVPAGAASGAPLPLPRAMRLLELSDLRTAARLAANVRVPIVAPDLTKPQSSSIRFGIVLVHQPTWSAEPGDVRLRDLRDLVERAEARGDVELLQRIAGWLKPLPTDALADPNDNGVRLAQDLGSDSEQGAELAGLRARIAARLEVERTRTQTPSAEVRSTDDTTAQAPTGPADPRDSAEGGRRVEVPRRRR